MRTGIPAAACISRISSSATTIPHRLTRTVTQMDNMLFSNMTLNPQPLHIDAHFCATETEWGKPLMNSLFTLGLMIGISVNDTTVGTTIANLGMTDVKFPASALRGRHGECDDGDRRKRESKSRPDAGIVDFVHRAYKQDGTLVAECRRQAFMRKRPAERADALAALRAGRQPEKLEKALDIRRRCAAHRPGGFGCARRQGRRAASHAPASSLSTRYARNGRASIVRVNGLTTGLIEADLDGVMDAGPDGIMLPKAVGGADVSHLGAKLAVREAEFGLADGATRILAIATENAAGIFALGTFAGASHRLTGLTWGGEDLSADLGAEANRDDDGAYTEPYRLARALTLFGAAAAGVDAINSVYTNFRDMDGLRAECREARRDGFVAKMAIHPAQVPVINEAFTPSSEAIERARAVVETFRANPEAGVVASRARWWTGRTCCGPNGFCAGPANSETPARKPQLHLSPDLGCSRDPFLLCKSGTPDLHGERSSAVRVRGHRSIRIRRNPSPAPPARPLPQGEVGQSLTSTDYRSGKLPVNYKPDFELQPRSTKRDSRLTSCA